ncbi:hypothetical protein BCR35DRAFT_333792 [Leucosporidium creatinivorum]|uniref:Uncharacterized protein n=1 Tax=Leucosporidium creatinivorum TaxID=106004 RepID=A0A1Y2ENF3_9BASI|nr:hypothetical protein BCR35DRAFT_333792 [Leucosporidium creatinivorum]
MDLVNKAASWLTGDHRSHAPGEDDYYAGPQYNMPPRPTQRAASYSPISPYTKDPTARGHHSRRESSSSLSPATEDLFEAARAEQEQAKAEQTKRQSSSDTCSASLPATTSPFRSNDTVPSTTSMLSTSPTLSARIEQSAIEHIAIAEQYEATHSRDRAEIAELRAELEQWKMKKSFSRLRSLEQELYRTRNEVGRMERRLLMAEIRTEEIGKQLHEEKEGRRALEAAYQRSEEMKEEMQKSLAQARAFLDLGDAGDLKLVVTGLKDINAAIDDISFSILEFVVDSLHQTPQTPVPPSLQADAIERARKGMLGAERLLDAASKHAEGQQAKAAHWRTTSYEAMDLATPAKLKALPGRITDQIFSTLLKLMEHSGLRCSPNIESFLSHLNQQLLRLVADSLAWHRLHRLQYLSTEFDIIYPAYSNPKGVAAIKTVSLPFDGATMEQIGGEEMNAELGGGGGRQVIATLAFGLEQVKLRKGSGGEERTERLPLLKAEVWTASERKKGRTEMVEDRRSTPKAG